jgi:hypothetical protein
MRVGEDDVHWPMHQEEIQILDTQILQALIQGGFDIFCRMCSVPELAGDEHLGARDAALFDAVAYFGLVAVDGRAVNVAVAGLEGRLNGALDLTRLCLPCAEAYGGYLRARVELEVCGERHDGAEVVGL